MRRTIVKYVTIHEVANKNLKNIAVGIWVDVKIVNN